ncbi:MAG: DUF4919 domain-containing protein [Chitinivibrionales bacterium]|nr:DUF4919 domain-containing protein [Chitinivibrionales bacterium]
MKQTLVGAIGVVTLVLSSCTSPPPQSLSQPPRVTRPIVDDSSYCAVVVGKLAAEGIGTAEIDFRRFRQSCFVNGQGEADPTLRRDLNTAIKEERCADAVELAESLLLSDFADIRTHVHKAYCHKKMGEIETYRSHMYFASGMIHSIVDGRTGRSMDDAFEVFLVSNEYGVLEYLELQLKSQSLVTRDGRSYDQMTCVNKRGDEVTIYFDVTQHMNRLAARMGG